MLNPSLSYNTHMLEAIQEKPESWAFLGIPLDEVFQKAMSETPPVGLGGFLSPDQQKFLAITLWNHYFRNHPNDEGKKVRDALLKRWAGESRVVPIAFWEMPKELQYLTPSSLPG